jgi:hypothetical protein
VRARAGRGLRLGGLAVVAVPGLWLVSAGPSCGPWGRTPGFALLGEEANGRLLDAYAVNGHPEIAVETRPPWLLPHSVTTSWLVVDGALFIPARDAAGKRWVRNVLRRPTVRIRVDDRLYAARLLRVDDPRERARLIDAAFQKWPQFQARGVDGEAMAFFRVESVAGG